MKLRELLAERVKTTRESLHWSQELLASKAGTTGKTISEIENKKTATNIELAENIALSFGWTAAELLDFKIETPINIVEHDLSECLRRVSEATARGAGPVAAPARVEPAQPAIAPEPPVEPAKPQAERRKRQPETAEELRTFIIKKLARSEPVKINHAAAILEGLTDREVKGDPGRKFPDHESLVEYVIEMLNEANRIYLIVLADYLDSRKTHAQREEMASEEKKKGTA